MYYRVEAIGLKSFNYRPSIKITVCICEIWCKIWCKIDILSKVIAKLKLESKRPVTHTCE